MTPQQFLNEAKSGNPAPLYLFAGPESYRRRICRRTLIDKFLPEEIREEGLSRHDLDEVTLRDVLDDASSFSLFASQRVLLVSSAEHVLPKGSAKEEDNPGFQALKDYAKNPTPGVVIIFDSQRITFDSDDKTKLDRLRKFYAPVKQIVEFHPYSSEDARRLAGDLAQRAGLKAEPGALESLCEALGNDAARIASELEKLALFLGGTRPVRIEDIAALSPDARETTIGTLVSAISRGDRRASLDLLETLVRAGEYLPLALSFLSTQFRLALAARDEGIRTQQQLQGHFAKLGINMWSSRLQQVLQTLQAFDKARLEEAIALIYQADKAFRDRSPDDRIVMENLVLRLTRK